MNTNLVDVSEQAIKKAREIIGAPPTEMIRKDISSGSGFAGYNLQPVAILLQPVITPIRNMLKRVQNKKGGTSSEWRYISALVTRNFDPTVATEGGAGNRLNYSATPASAPFVELALGDQVTWAADDAAKGFEDDLKPRAVTNLLLALMMMEEIMILFGRIENLGAVTAPTVTNADGGGTIADGTYNVKVRAIIGCGDGTNTRGRISTATTTGALGGGGDNVIKATTPWVEGAVQYEWYVDDGAAGAYTLQQTTGTNVAIMTALTTTGTVAPADNVTNAKGIKGLVASFTAALGASVTTLATDSTTFLGTDFTLDDIDAANKAAWDNAKASPEVIFMNSTQAIRATNLVLAANGAPTLFVRAESKEMAQLTGGYMLTNYVNKATGKLQQIIVHPNMPDGTMVAFSMIIPFPTGGDMVGIDIETSRDYQQVDYARTARRDDFEVFCREALRVKFPGGAWVIRNIKSNRLA